MKFFVQQCVKNHSLHKVTDRSGRSFLSNGNTLSLYTCYGTFYCLELNTHSIVRSFIYVFMYLFTPYIEGLGVSNYNENVHLSEKCRW